MSAHGAHAAAVTPRCVVAAVGVCARTQQRRGLAYVAPPAGAAAAALPPPRERGKSAPFTNEQYIVTRPPAAALTSVAPAGASQHGAALRDRCSMSAKRSRTPNVKMPRCAPGWRYSHVTAAGCRCGTPPSGEAQRVAVRRMQQTAFDPPFAVVRDARRRAAKRHRRSVGTLPKTANGVQQRLPA